MQLKSWRWFIQATGRNWQKKLMWIFFYVCGKIYPKHDWTMHQRKQILQWIIQELIDELHCSYQIQENRRKTLDGDEIDTDAALSAVNFCWKFRKCGKIRYKAKDLTNLNGSNSNLNGIQAIQMVIWIVKMEIQVLLIPENF